MFGRLSVNDGAAMNWQTAADELITQMPCNIAAAEKQNYIAAKGEEKYQAAMKLLCAIPPQYCRETPPAWLWRLVDLDNAIFAHETAHDCENGTCALS